jgi:hypothetical protein
MNTLENIQYLAQVNAKGFAPKETEDDVNKSIPYFKLEYGGNNKYTMDCFNYEFHDNMPRMDLFKAYMMHAVLPNLSTLGSALNGYYNIELHDSYTYLGRPRDMYRNVLTFSKFKDDTGPTLVPDPYMIVNWGNALSSVNDKYQWEDKQNKACFYGTTTGNRNPKLNDRINMCLWAVNKPQLDFKITQIAQMNVVDVINSVGEDTWKLIYSSQVQPEHQMRCKFIYGMDGNTCKFDVWPHLTNSLCLRKKSPEMLWYYPLMQNNTHFVEVDTHNMIELMNYHVNNPNDSKRIVANSNVFSNAFFKPVSHILYTTALFEAIALNAK